MPKDKDSKPAWAVKGAHRKGRYRCSARGCPGHDQKEGFCTLV